MKRMMLCLAVLIVIAAPCAAQGPQGPFTDVPTDHWAYQDVDTLQKAGIVFGYPDGTGGNRRMNREEFAANTVRLLSHLFEAPTALGADLRTRLLASPSAISALQDLVLHFKLELMQLNVSVSRVQTRLAEMAQTAAHSLTAKPF